MIEVIPIQRLYGSMGRHYQEEGNPTPKRKPSFEEYLKKEEEKSMVSEKTCEQELLTLWEKFAGDCKKLQLFIHPNVYRMMAEDPAFRERIKKRLSDTFLDTSLLYPAITLARLDAGEVYITITYNGELSYKKFGF